MSNPVSDPAAVNTATSSIIEQILSVIVSDKHIWIPVLAAWALGFVYTRYLNASNLKRRSDREFRVYVVNGGTAFILYVAFNFKVGIDVFLPQATLAAAVAVLIPAIWFWYKAKK